MTNKPDLKLADESFGQTPPDPFDLAGLLLCA